MLALHARDEHIRARVICAGKMPRNTICRNWLRNDALSLHGGDAARMSACLHRD
jgi:hypothetical protein